MAAEEAPASASAPPKIRTILVFGDSNTWGYDADTSERFPYHARWTTHLLHALNEESGAGRNPSPVEYHVIVEGLNGRTTVFPDSEMPLYANPQDCVGRNYLLPCLHSHKPVDLVILALGVNDLKRHLKTTPADIANGVVALVKDIRNATSTGSCLVDELGGMGAATAAPLVLVLTPPELLETPKNLEWGFSGCVERGGQIHDLVVEKAGGGGEMGAVEVRSTTADFGGVVSEKDGIHLTLECQRGVGESVAKAVVSLLEGQGSLGVRL